MWAPAAAEAAWADVLPGKYPGQRQAVQGWWGKVRKGRVPSDTLALAWPEVGSPVEVATRLLERRVGAIAEAWTQCLDHIGMSSVAEVMGSDAAGSIESLNGLSWSVLPVYANDVETGHPGATQGEVLEEHPCVDEFVRTVQDMMRVEGFPPVLEAEFLGVTNPQRHPVKGAGLSRHVGPSNENWKIQVGMVVPPSCKDPGVKCQINVGNYSVPYAEGRSVVVVDAYDHDVEYEAAGTRWILEVSVCRPDLGRKDARHCLYKVCRDYARRDRGRALAPQDGNGHCASDRSHCIPLAES